MEQEARAVSDQIITDYITRPEFKRLLLELDISLTDQGLKTLSVMSLFHREGKSFVVTALAYGTAHLLGKRVLVVDCEQAYREQSLISAWMPLPQTLDHHPVVIDIMTAQSLTGGNARHADFKLRSALASLAPSYDRIFIDAGAIYPETEQHFDPIIAAKQSGATLIVTSPYSLHRTSVADLQMHIASSGIPVIGTVHSEMIR